MAVNAGVNNADCDISANNPIVVNSIRIDHGVEICLN